MPPIDAEKEKKDILKAYGKLLRSTKRHEAKGDLKLIRKAFEVALDAHKDMRRKSGEPYIYHPIAVAEIVTSEIGLGAKSIVCALLHDTVEDTDLTIEDMRKMFGDKVAQIIDGLTKLSSVLDIGEDKSLQAENFRKMLLTMSSDIRVILIKLADRLHNMRTLGSMRRDKQLKIASETLYLYAPLAHRLGLYTIKTELGDLSFKYIEPELYEEINTKLRDTQRQRTRFINKFSFPIINSLNEGGIDFEIKGRTKSVHSIARKMKKQGVPFEGVFDIFAIRIIVKSSLENEKADCWKAFSIVTDHYVSNPGRFRDWLSKPKTNGYESLHTTVMSDKGKWVEVQIRTERMDGIAEKGLAAHWKYKDSGQVKKSGDNPERGFDDWLNKIRDLLESPDRNAIDFIDDIKLNLFADEIFVFTPTGEVRTLPVDATSLDFAFDIHSEVGMRCMGAKVNGKLYPLSHQLKSGDQVEVLTSNKQKPKEDWLTFVVTGKAKSKIKQALKEESRRIAADGKEIVTRKLKQMKMTLDRDLTNKLHQHFKVQTSQDLFIKVAQKTIDFKEIKAFIESSKNEAKWYNVLRKRIAGPRAENGEDADAAAKRERPKDKGDTIVIGDASQKMDYVFAKCCSPIPGDKIFGFVSINDGIKIHRTNCPNAIHIRANYAYRIQPASWANKEDHTAFATGILIRGIDDAGVVNAITNVIYKDLNVNMKRVAFDSNDGIFEGHIEVLVQGIHHLNNLIENLRKVDGIKSIVREDEIEAED
ncbi:MAG: bifunctional (p)ppGpp synthetase/guanosine-3',5'-bis(diphosphate) 3'-pyrophosphohydrolase [Flavobacteriales bacterium]|nr:bifunctional (p)ppGpp synthetase/guanosine-3',5'-bis(diphosphate) 3'-pyrophosphohydrolase [Flavobacteriales bacterium]